MIPWWMLIPACCACTAIGMFVGGWNRANAAVSRDEERRAR